MLVPDKLIWIFQKLQIYWHLHTKSPLGFTAYWPEKEKISSMYQFSDQKCLADVWGQEEGTTTQITTYFSHRMLKSLSEHKKPHWPFKQMRYSSQRPQQFAQADQNWTTEVWKNVAWYEGLELGVNLMTAWLHPALYIYIWRLNWWSWGKGAEDIFLAYIELLSTNRKTFNCHSLHGYCSWPSPLLYDRSLPVAKTSHKAQIILNWLLEHDSAFTVPQSSPIQPGTSGMLSGQPR